MNAVAASAITAVGAAILAAVGTYVSTRRNLQTQYDADLRKLRLDAYADLWQRLAPLAKYGRRQPLTATQGRALGDSLRTWYFCTGGIYLSTETRSDYFALQDGIEALVRDDPAKEELTRREDDFLRALGSRLRTGMTRDVGTRRTFMFREDTEPLEGGSWRFHEPVGGRSLHLTLRRRFLPRLPSHWHRPTAAFVAIAQAGTAPSAVRPADEWDGDRRTFVLGLDRPAGGPVRRRRFILEAGELLEGPAGWRMNEDAPPDEAVAWHFENGDDHGA